MRAWCLQVDVPARAHAFCATCAVSRLCAAACAAYPSTALRFTAQQRRGESLKNASSCRMAASVPHSATTFPLLPSLRAVLAAGWRRHAGALPDRRTQRATLHRATWRVPGSAPSPPSISLPARTHGGAATDRPASLAGVRAFQPRKRPRGSPHASPFGAADMRKRADSAH
jgi:hypothetical protein